MITQKRITKATQIATQPPPKDGDELGSDTRRGSSAYKTTQPPTKDGDELPLLMNLAASTIPIPEGDTNIYICFI